MTGVNNLPIAIFLATIVGLGTGYAFGRQSVTTEMASMTTTSTTTPILSVEGHTWKCEASQ